MTEQEIDELAKCVAEHLLGVLDVSISMSRQEMVEEVKEGILLYEGDEEGVGNWMIEWEQKMRVKHRIACPEQGYPESEALYTSVEEWEEATGECWLEVTSP